LLGIPVRLPIWALCLTEQQA
ncbi:hypothetical protein A5814_002740, partial [Enterococcus faecium]